MKVNSVLLLVGLKCGPEREAEFNEWYPEHIALMLEVPGCTAASRYKITQPNEDYPNYLTIYEFESQQALE